MIHLCVQKPRRKPSYAISPHESFAFGPLGILQSAIPFYTLIYVLYIYRYNSNPTLMKYVIGIVAALIALFAILGVLGPKDMNVNKSTTIEAPATIVYHLVNHLENTTLWNDWSLRDTSMTNTYGDKKEGVGATSSWKSKESGNGSQTIIESIPDQKVRSSFDFEGWEGDNFAQFDINQTGNATDVSWGFEGSPLPFFFRPIALLTGMKTDMNRSYEKGLANLKTVAEERAKGLYFGQQIVEKDLDEKHFVIHRQEIETKNIQQFYTTHLGQLFGLVQKSGVEMKGMPCGLFFKFDDGKATADMAAAIPVAEEVSISNAGSLTIPAQKAITLDFYGNYDRTILGHNAIEAYMKDRGYLQNPPIIEEYITDPSTEEDTDKWLTKMTYFFTESQK